MFERSDSLVYADGVARKAIKLLILGPDEDSVFELEQLLQTLGIEVAERVVAPLKQIHAASYYGAGKIQEIASLVLAHEADGVAFDVDLSPNQLRNLEKLLKGLILDRSGIIIEIFSAHARTKESKTQVALARMQYLLPRLTHFWNHFERQRGGGTGSRGMGEKQLEVDRRLVKKRISVLKERLKEIERERETRRSGRKDILKAALVGYTNVGKSTLLNALTTAETRAEDKLFATLDSSVRLLDPKCHPKVVLIDTVGFIERLPPALVASFRSTLEELREAELMIHVVDASHPRAVEQMRVTESILEDLGLGQRPRLSVLNKWDLVTSGAQKALAKVAAPGAITCSAHNSSDCVKLRGSILDFFIHQLETFEVLIPYTESKMEGLIHEYGSVEKKSHLEKGTFLRFRMDKTMAAKLCLERFGFIGD